MQISSGNDGRGCWSRRNGEVASGITWILVPGKLCCFDPKLSIFLLVVIILPNQLFPFGSMMRKFSIDIITVPSAGVLGNWCIKVATASSHKVHVTAAVPSAIIVSHTDRFVVGGLFSFLLADRALLYRAPLSIERTVVRSQCVSHPSTLNLVPVNSSPSRMLLQDSGTTGWFPGSRLLVCSAA